MFFIHHLSSFSHEFQVSHIFSFLSQYLKQSNNYTKFILQIISTPELENTQFAFHISSEHRTSERYQGSADSGRLYLNTFVN